MFETTTRHAAQRRADCIRWLSLALLTLTLDQLSKWMVARALPLGGSVAVTGFFNLVHIQNPGAAFSMLAAQGGWQRWLFTALGLGAAGAIIGLLCRRRLRGTMAAGLALILGGALGNVLDRVLWGRVTDFLDVYLQLAHGQWHWPAFNLADSAITLGVVLLLLDEWQQGRRRGQAKL